MKSPLNDQSSELNPNPSDTHEPPLSPSACISDVIVQVSFALSLGLCVDTPRLAPALHGFSIAYVPCVIKSLTTCRLTESVPATLSI